MVGSRIRSDDRGKGGWLLQSDVFCCLRFVQVDFFFLGGWILVGEKVKSHVFFWGVCM